MPGRLLSSLVRSTSPSSAWTHSNSSSTSSVNEIASSKRNSLHLHPDGSHESSERRLSFSMDHIIHPNKEKRLSLGRSSRSKDRSGSKEDSRASGAKLDMIIESPPLVFYGTPANSSGALFSGRLRVAVPESAGVITLDKFDMHLTLSITTKKPISRDCRNCSTRTNDLCYWDFLTEPIHLKPGDHDFPFSYLFPGNLPASAQGSLGTVEYLLSARAILSTGEEITMKTPLTIQRAILPGNDRSSVRIFPPTNLTGRVVLPSVVHPIGSFPVQMTLSGIVEKGEESQTRWRLRKMMWRIEEHQKIVSTACAKHAHKIGGEGKGVLHQETRIIGHNEEKSGWKTDFDTAGGEINMEFEACIKPGSKPVCDLETPGGLEVKHNLVIELIVAEEFCPNKNTKLITPTGAARVLRMQFNLLVTERSGLGISWDEEMPPMYNDVPASPPGYSAIDPNCAMEDYNGSPLPPLPQYEELERMDCFRLESNSKTNDSSQPSGRNDESQQLTRQQTRLTVDDLTAEPPMMESRSRAPPDENNTAEAPEPGSMQ